MAEAFGMAVSTTTIAAEFAFAIPGLFIDCVELFSLVRLGYEFQSDFGSWNLQLRANELRFQRWGRAAGITDARSEVFVKHFQENYSPRDVKLAYNACDQIKGKLQKAMEDFRDISKLSDNPAELKMIDELQQLEISEPGIKRANSALGRLKSRYQSALKLTTKVAVRSKWALYKKSQFEDLLRVIAEHVTVLEQLFPQQERALAAQEARTLEPEALKALTDVATASDPLLAEALRAEAPRKGLTYENITATGNATLHVGNNYRTVPENKVASSWTDIKKDGNAVVHVGHNYGYHALPQMQSAPGHRPLDAGSVASMDDDDRPSGRSRISPQIQSAYSGRSRSPPRRPHQRSHLQSVSDQLPMRQDDQIMVAKSKPTQMLPFEFQREVERGTKRSLRHTELPQWLVDRSHVYDDDQNSPQGSVTAPETYSTNPKPFQGSMGYSSVGDALTRATSSATGLETHGIPEEEYGGIERDCSDDEHAADTMSIHTDGREHNLTPDTKLSLTEAFAGHIVENLTPQQLNDLFDQPDAIASIAELIGDFSVLLGVSIADDDARSRAVTFVRHQRTEIAKELASAAKAWRPSTEDQVSMEEKFQMLHFDDTEPTQYDDPNPEQDSRVSHEDGNQLDNSPAGNNTPELRDVVLGRNFVLGSDELPWMIDRIRKYESLLHTGKIFSSVRSGIARTIESHSEHVEFSLDWDIRKTLDQQYDGESRSQIRLSEMIVYNGTPSMCYASTTSEYVKQIWPALGSAVVECFDHALVSADSTSTLAFQDSRLHVKLDGATTKVSLVATTEQSTSQSRIHMLEAAEVCIWLATACCANTREESIGLSFPQLANVTGQLAPTESSGSVINDPSLDGQCWFNMVNNPAIASGYPIPKREDASKQQGLEVSLGLMADLSHADWVTNFGSKLLLKGTISALVPIAEFGMSIVWHFLIKANQESISYEQACAAAIDTPHLTYSDLESRRHFVGLWAQSGRILAGSNQNTTYDLYPSRSKPLSHSTISLTGLSINGGKFLTVGTTFNIGKKDLAPALKASESRVYDHHIGDASNMTVLFYSSLDRRGWLLDGASALVHLARAWLTTKKAEHETSGAIGQLHYIQDNGGRSSAMKVLRANQKVVIFEDTTEVHETSIPAETSFEHDNPSTDSGYMSGAGSASTEIKRSTKRTKSQWTYKALIIDLWRNLEAMKAKLVQLKQHGPELGVRWPLTSPELVGWDVSDFLIGRTPLEPRSVELRREGKAWNKLTKEIFSVPLMAESFVDLIRPDTGSQVCQSADTLPAKRDLLAVPLPILLLTASRFLRWQENLAHEYARVTDHTFLVAAKHPKDHCRCSKHANCEAVSGLTKDAIKGTRTGPSIFERCPDAVVIIGTPNTGRIWEPKTQDSGSSKQAVSPVSDHHAASSSSAVRNTTSDAQPASQSSQVDLNEGDGESQYAASSSRSVANIVSDDRSASQENRQDLHEGESGPSTQAVLPTVDHAAAPSSSSAANVIPDAHPASQDNRDDLREGECNSVSGDSVYESCEDL